jgi:exopolyphosphatase / guanosine-5'-triphosphate,3'-diphosphate pyrophosphatase
LFDLFGERRRPQTEPIGVIDIGSNSVRLVIYEGAVRAPAPLFNEKVLCGLGKTLSSTGELAEESVDRALRALERFRSIARVLGVKNLRLIGTAAVRDASNGAQFIQRAEVVSGARIEILSGKREAELVADGIRMGFCRPSGIAGDMGGGSLELVDIDGDDLMASTTTPLGALRLMDLTNDKLDKAEKIIDDELSNHKWLKNGKGRPFYVVGGTWRALAKVHMEQQDYPLRVMHGYTLSVEEAIRFLSSIRKAKKPSAISGIEIVNRARRDALPYGALLMEKVIKKISPSEVVMSVHGIREGTLYSLLPRHEREKDPLICFCENYARLRSRSVEHAWELCQWTDRLFEKKELKESERERRLRHAACLVSDIGWRSHPDYRGDQSLNLIANAGMAGIDHAGRVFLALSVFYRHVGLGSGSQDQMSARLKTAITDDQDKRARIVGAAIRTAHMLSIGMPGIIDETRLFYEGEKQLILNIPRAHEGLDGERLRRRLDVLANEVDCQAVVRVASA